MAIFTDVIRKHPVLTYFVLTFAISWGCIFLVIGSGAFWGGEAIAQEKLPLVYVATLAGPSMAGVLLTGWLEGRRGFWTLGARLLHWRIGVRWYAVALLTAPIAILVTLGALSLISPVFLPAIVTAQDKIGLVVTGIVMGLMVGLCEELGWTGFAVPRLSRVHGVLFTGIGVGVLWGVWHFPLFVGSSASSGAIPPALYLAVLLFSFLPPYRVLMAWVYSRTESLFLVVLMHAPLAGSQLVLIPPTITGPDVIAYDLALAAILWILVMVVVKSDAIAQSRGKSVERST